MPPNYYELNDGDVLSALERLGEGRGFYRGLVMKYAWRAFQKDINTGVEDLKKLVDCATRWLVWEEQRRK